MTNFLHENGTLVPRRTLLTSAAAAVALGVSGCGALSLEPAVSDPALPAEPGQKEAPQLAARVARGELPPVQERLPREPEVITPRDRLGGYGGTWRSGMLGTVSIYQAYTYTATDSLLRWSEDFTTPEPNIAESVEVLDDGRSFLFTLRDGVRWSDGALFTSDDVVFAVDDVLTNPDLAASSGLEFAVNGDGGRIEKIDALRFAFHFESVNGLFLANLAGPRGYTLVQYPRHYLEQFHQGYAADVDAVATEQGFASWADYFFSKVGRGYWDLPRWQTNELPTVACWVVREPLGQGSRVVLERNPYYYKVDTDGRQLPYIDEVAMEVIGDPELMTIQATNGELTLPQADILTLNNKPILAANRAKRDYHFVEAVTTELNQLSIQLNLNVLDDVLGEVFRNRDFRIALSTGIDRQEVIDAVFQRQGEPWQLAPRRESPFWDEEMATQFTEFDPEASNALLDAIGLDQRGRDGIRLLPDGRPLAFDMSVVTQRPSSISVLDLVAGHWRRIGVSMRVQSMDRSLFYQRKSENQLTSAVWTAGGALLDAMYDPRLWMPNGGECLFAPEWSLWFTSNGEEGQEPPARIQEQMATYRQISVTIDPDEQIELFRGVLRIAKEEFFAIGVCLPEGDFSVVQDSFGNFPDQFISSFLYPTPGPLHPEQFYIEAGAA